MHRPKTLAARLTMYYAGAFIAGLLIFSAFALLTIDRVQRASANAALQSEAVSAAALITPEKDSGELDSDNANAFRHALGGQANAAFFDRRGHAQVSTAVDVPDQVTRIAQSPDERMHEMTIDGAPALAVARPVRRGTTPFGTVVVWRPAGEVADIDRRAILSFSVAIVVLGVTALAAGRTLTRRALDPLRELAVVIAEIEAADLSGRIGRTADDEVGLLCAAFDRMLARLEDAFLRQRRFAGDVAHEVRAPLAVILAEIDVVRRKSRSSLEYERALDAVRDAALRLDHMATTLLATYRENAEPQLGSIRASDLVEDAIHILAPLAAAHGTAIDVVSQEARGLIIGDRAELTRAVIAMLDNAIKYGGEHRDVTVSVDEDEDTIHIAVRDRGPGFSADALVHATERFWRDRRVSGFEGSGLGLSLAAAILTRAGGALALSNADDGGGVVTMHFPRMRQFGSSKSHVEGVS